VAKQAVIGNPFTFQARFLDATNTAFDPTVGPTITLFSYSLAGAKNVLVDDVAMDAVVPAEVGRFTYVYNVPNTFTDGDLLYAEVNGEDAVANKLVQTDEVVLIAATRSGAFTTGLIIEFVDGG
jgi:hypothetical protein